MHYFTTAPFGIVRHSSHGQLIAFDAARIMPCDSSPRSLTGFRFVTQITLRPTSSSGCVKLRDARDDLALLISEIELQLQQLIRFLHRLGSDHLCDAQLDLGKIVDRDFLLMFFFRVRRGRLPRASAVRSSRRLPAAAGFGCRVLAIASAMYATLLLHIKAREDRRLPSRTCVPAGSRPKVRSDSQVVSSPSAMPSCSQIFAAALASGTAGAEWRRCAGLQPGAYMTEASSRRCGFVLGEHPWLRLVNIFVRPADQLPQIAVSATENSIFSIACFHLAYVLLHRRFKLVVKCA